MKHLTLILFALLISNANFGQNNFDIVSYTLPVGWQIVEQSPNLVLQKQSEAKNSCQIIIYPSTKGSINTNDEFKMQWEKYVKNKYTEVENINEVELSKSDEWQVYSINSYVTRDKMQVVSFFTSLSDKNYIVNIDLIAPDKSCMDEMNNFLNTILIRTTVNNKGKKAIVNKKVVIKSKRSPKFRPGKALRDAVF